MRSLAELGRFDEAARYAIEAIGLAESTQHAYAIGMAHWTAGWLLLVQGDWARARPRIEHGIAALRSADAVLALPWAVASGAWVLGQLGDTDEVLNRLRHGEQLVQDLAARQVAASASRTYHALGRGYLILGRPDDARRLSGRALDGSSIWPGDVAHALHLRADVQTHPSACDAASGEADYQKALTLADSRGMRPLVAHCHLGLGRLYRRAGRRAAADEHLTAAATMYRDMAMSFWLKQVEADPEAPSR